MIAAQTGGKESTSHVKLSLRRLMLLLLPVRRTNVYVWSYARVPSSSADLWWCMLISSPFPPLCGKMWVSSKEGKCISIYATHSHHLCWAFFIIPLIIQNRSKQSFNSCLFTLHEGLFLMLKCHKRTSSTNVVASHCVTWSDVQAYPFLYIGIHALLFTVSSLSCGTSTWPYSNSFTCFRC